MFGILKNQAKAYYNAKVADFVMKNNDIRKSSQGTPNIELPEINLKNQLVYFKLYGSNFQKKTFKKLGKKHLISMKEIMMFSGKSRFK